MIKLEFPTPLTGASKRRAVALVGQTYEVDGAARSFDGPFTIHTIDSAREVVALPASVRTDPNFAGADGLAVWASFVRDPAFDSADLNTCREPPGRPWPDDVRGNALPPTQCGANHQGSIQHHASLAARR